MSNSSNSQQTGEKGTAKGAGVEASEAADRILERVERDSEKIGFSNMDLLRRPPEDDADDPLVIAGKRAGRTLGYIALAALVVYLLYNAMSG